MNYPWYFPVGGNNEQQPMMKTITLQVTTDIRTIEATIENINPSTFAYFSTAFKEENENYVATNIKDILSFAEENAKIEFSWETPFNGFINVNYWEKTE